MIRFHIINKYIFVNVCKCAFPFLFSIIYRSFEKRFYFVFTQISCVVQTPIFFTLFFELFFKYMIIYEKTKHYYTIRYLAVKFHSRCTNGPKCSLHWSLLAFWPIGQHFIFNSEIFFFSFLSFFLSIRPKIQHSCLL